jgi:MFS family permease
MEEQNVEGSESAVEKQEESKSPKRSKKIMLWGGIVFGIALIGAVLVYILLPKAKEVAWFSNQMIAIYIAVGLVGGGILAGFLFRKPLRTRLRMQKVIKEDADINDWLVIFSWTPKILYVPTIIASFLAAVLSCFEGIPPAAIGGIWAGIFFMNFLIEEYNISIKILLIAIVSIGFFLLWLHLLGWVVPFLKLFQKIALSMNPPVYLFVGMTGLLAVFVSWLQGLFYYVSITPNYMNLQEGPTESGEQIGREDYNSRIDTSDFLERLMGFGRIVITFKERKRQPIVVLVWRIQKKAQMLERVRAKFAIDHQPRTQTLKQ